MVCLLWQIGPSMHVVTDMLQWYVIDALIVPFCPYVAGRAAHFRARLSSGMRDAHDCQHQVSELSIHAHPEKPT